MKFEMNEFKISNVDAAPFYSFLHYKYETYQTIFENTNGNSLTHQCQTNPVY